MRELKKTEKTAKGPNKRIWIVLVVVFVTVSLVVLSLVNKSNKGDPASTIQEDPWSDYVSDLMSGLPDCQDKDLGLRDDFPEEYDYLPRKMFCDLPPMHEDFEKFMTLYKSGKLTSFHKFGPEMWAQPEFQVNYRSTVVKTLQNPNPNRFGVTLPTVTPGDIRVSVHPNTRFNTYTTVRSSPKGQFFLGIRPTVVYPEQFGGVVQDPEKAEEYIEMRVTPETLVLAPSWPYYMYDEVTDEKYVRLLNMTIYVKPGTPPGKYFIGMDFETPGEGFNERMYTKYMTKYTGLSTFSQMNRPWFVMQVEVEGE